MNGHPTPVQRFACKTCTYTLTATAGQRKMMGLPNHCGIPMSEVNT